MTSGLFLIVEGHGEASALPTLVTRIGSDLLLRPLRVFPAYRVSRESIRRFSGQMEQAVEVARRNILANAGRGGLLVLYDADDDCAAKDHLVVHRRITDAGFPYPHATVMCVREYESWLLSAAASLRSDERVRDDAAPPPEPEGIRNAKGYFNRMVLRDGETYSEAIDQKYFSARIDLGLARNAPSFDKFVREVDRLTSG